MQGTRRVWRISSLLIWITLAGVAGAAGAAVDESAGDAPGSGPAELAGSAPTPVLADLSESNGAVVPVPAGEFYYGCNEEVDDQCDEDERPGRRIVLETFAIDRTEVTIASYRECVEADVCTAPASYGPCNWGKPDREDHPVNCVDWMQSRAYCRWQGQRLPTEQEWEKAARGTAGFKFPWGNEEPTCERATMLGCGWGTKPSGVRELGASPYGALDMAGNLWEWTDSWFDESRRVHTIRGGSWFTESSFARASSRYDFRRGVRVHLVGFRCAE